MGIVHPLNALKANMEGKQTHLAAQELQNLKGFVPAGNVWYAKAVFDHLIWQRIMEAVSPGYLASIRGRSIRDWHQDWWWAPGDTFPEGSPRS